MVMLPEDLDRLQGTAQPGGPASPLMPNDLDEAVKNIRATSDIKSPRAIQAIKASRDTGLSTNITLADPQSVQLRQMERGMRAALTDAPKTASLMSGDPMQAAAVKEDYESLSLLERLLQGGDPMIDNEFNFAEDTGFGGSFASAAKQLVRAVPGMAKSTNEILAMGAGALDSTERGLGNVLGSGSTGVFGNARDWLLGQSEWINKNILQDPSLMLPEDKQGQLLKSEGGWNYSWAKPELLLDPEWLTFNAGEVASSMAPMLAATYATGGSTLVGALVGSGQEAGDLYRELIRDGNDPDKALTASTLFGVGVGWLNKVGLDKMLDKTVATTLFKRAAKSLTAGTVEGITEYLEEPLQAMMKGWAEQKSFPEIAADVQASLANIDVIPGSILFGGGVSYSTHYKAEYQRARFSESEQKFLDQIDQAAATPQMAQHDPLLYQETLRVLKDGGKVTHVYIPAQALGSLYSGEGLSKIVDSLGVREQYGDMAEVGGDLKVEIGDYIKTVAADPNFAPTVVNDRRLSEDGFTRNELATMQKEQAQEFQSVLEAVKSEREAESAIEAEGQQIYKQVVEMRRASGMVSASVTADAAQMAAFYTTMAKRSDSRYTPMQLFTKYGPSEVRGAPVAQTGELRQDAIDPAGADFSKPEQVAEAQKLWETMGTDSPYFKWWFGDSKVVDAQGKPLVVYHATLAEAAIKREGFKSESGIYWFTDSQEIGMDEATGGSVMPVYLSMRNPLVWREGMPDFENTEEISRIKAAGYDGIIAPSNVGGMDYIAFDPTQIKSVFNRGTFDASDPRILMQSAYHGSPYRFDKFTLDHIGSGEGAQAYGWGLYFAGNKEVAEYYRSAVSETQSQDKIYRWLESIGLQPMNSTLHSDLAAEIFAQKGDLEATVRKLDQLAKMYRRDGSRDMADAFAGLSSAVRRGIDEGKALDVETGQLYEVTIPDDDTMLDWDKPLSEQPEQVKKALEGALAFYKQNRGVSDRYMEWEFQGADASKIYQELASILSPKGASEYLKSIGIPGLRYLDGTSRGKGEGHHNYVVFDDAQIAIDKTYYQKPLASDINMGAVTFDRLTGKPIIDLFTKANASTFLHESGHTYFEAIKQMAAVPDAPRQIKEIWTTAQAGLYKLADSAAARANQRTDLARITGDDVRAFIDAGMPQTTPQNRAAYIGVQEEWARQLEAYFMEGKTPNLELRAVFQKFKDWLRAIYENFAKLGMAEPSAEMKPVFDRIFATDQQIAEAEGFYLATKPFLDQGFEMAEEDRAAYLARVNKAKETANDARMRKLAKAYIQALGGKDEFIKAATEEINASPIYKAMDEILAEGGYSREAVEAIVGKEAAAALSKRRRGLVTKDGAEPVLRPGFDSLPAMLNALMAAPIKKDAIKNLTETKIAQERKFLEQMIHDDNVLPGDEDYHNDDRLALLHAEFILLSKQVKGRELAARMKDAQLEVAAVREAARQAITKMAASTATSPSKFARQERKAAKEAFLAKAKGDMAAMAEAKRKEMLNHALFMEAAIAREQMEKLERGAKRMVNSKSMKRESRTLAERLAIQFGLHRPTKQRTASAEWADYRARLAVEEKDIPTVMAWSEAMYELGYDVAFDPFILTTQEPLDYKTLTWGQVLAVREALNIIRTIDKNERTVFLNGERIALEEMRTALAAGLDPVLTKEKPAPKAGSPYIDKPGIKGLVKGIHANHLKLEAILQRLDGWKTGGIWWNTFFRPVAGAEDARSLRLKQVAADLKEMFALYAKKKGDLFNKQILIPVLGRSFTKSQLLAVALNTGNEGNLLRLAKGECWTVLDQNGRDAADMQKILAVLQPLEKQDWDFVQKVWNYLDTFRPEAFQLEERLTGKMPERVEAKPVQTPFGQYAGGYYPAVYDSDRSYTTFSRKQAEDDKSLFGRNHGSSQTKHNHLKARAQSGGDQKVSFDLGVLSEHLFTVVHDITHREPLLEVAKLVRDKEISKMIEDTLGKEVYREFMPWLQDVARERMVPPFTRLERLAAWARKGTTMMSLGLKMTTIITQPFGLTQTFEALGPSYTMLGISKVYRNLPEMYRTITEKSVFMANRLENFDREVRDSMKGVTAFRDNQKAVEKFAYYGIGMAQMGVDLPTWWGGYQKALAEFNGDEAKAVAYADSVVRLSQSSGATKDLSRVQRGPELQRMFTMFYSYFNMLYNLAYRAGTRFKGDHNIPRAAASAMLLWFLPAILTELATGRGPDDDEGEERMSWAGTKLALYPMNMIVGLRDLTNAIGSGFDYQTTPASGAPASIVKWVKAVNKAIEEEEPERLIKPTVEMIGFAAHLPLKQVEITVGNVWDYVTGEDPDLQVRDLFFNKPKSRR